MTIPEILKELERYTGRFPKQAMQAAIEQREVITPELLQVLERAAEDPVKFAERKDYMLHVFAMYLLAQFREKRAYRPLVRMFSAPGETPLGLAGDTVTERPKSIFGSVYDGDPAPLDQRLLRHPSPRADLAGCRRGLAPPHNSRPRVRPRLNTALER